MIPYSLEVFIALLSEHIAANWPWPAFSLFMAFILVLFVSFRFAIVSSLLTTYLVFIWAWVGIIYHLNFYATLNWAGTIFGAIFLVQAVLIAWVSLIRSRTDFQLERTTSHMFAIPVLIYLLVVHPFLGPSSFSLIGSGNINFTNGSDFSASYQVVGATPDATNLFTLAVYTLSINRVPRLVLVIPLLWCLFSAYWAWLVGAYGKLLLPVLSALVWMVVVFIKAPHSRAQSNLE